MATSILAGKQEIPGKQGGIGKGTMSGMGEFGPMPPPVFLCFLFSC
jgi:hypothetical protein